MLPKLYLIGEEGFENNLVVQNLINNGWKIENEEVVADFKNFNKTIKTVFTPVVRPFISVEEVIPYLRKMIISTKDKNAVPLNFGVVSRGIILEDGQKFSFEKAYEELVFYKEDKRFGYYY